MERRRNRHRLVATGLWVAVGIAVLLSAGCGDGGSEASTANSPTGSTTSSGAPGGATDSAPADPTALGERLVADHNCQSCHSTNGTKLAGPTWKGLAGSSVELSNGQTVKADHDYLVRSILDPDAQVVEGFSSGIMAALIRPGSIKPEEADAIARYIESLG